ncbi:MAG: hypothetical protein V4550_18410 [Gemmatimonadota bacterium]
MSLNQRAQRGFDVVVACHRIGDDAPANDDEFDTSADIVVERFDGFTEAVTELVGVDMSQVTPYLSAFASGFGAGGSPDAKAVEAAKVQAEAMRKQEEKRAADSKKTTMWVVGGLIGAAVLGGGVYLVARK